MRERPPETRPDGRPRIFDPSLDVGDDGRPEVRYAIAMTQRTGSTLLCDTLRRTGRAGVPAAYLFAGAMLGFRRRFGVPRISLHGHVARAKGIVARDPRWRFRAEFRTRDLAPYLREVERHRTTANGFFGLKVSRRQLRQACEAARGDPGLLRSIDRWVFLTRRDKVRQAVSHVRALESDRWQQPSTGAAGPEPVYDAAAIAASVARFRADEAEWGSFFDEGGIEPLVVSYEDLDADHERTVAGILEHLGLPAVPVPGKQLQRQADQLTEGWVERFRAERR